ncbi:MAG TPA: phospholipase D-like domain-containing protein [Pyrinomonadaceae bacterium]|nr:phospholipase D-like domain-containing protein [Pyrinomonadaceae bacterium]
MSKAAIETRKVDYLWNSEMRVLANQAFSRAAGAPLVTGNSISILKDAQENYPAWLDAIASAERTIHFETYIIHADSAGEQFAEALANKAREGVKVRLIYDWLGALGYAWSSFWRSLERAGVEVRCFNPPRFDSPFGWLSRDHRKVIVVDGRRGFVTGLCVGTRWVGYPERGIEPWRDTGIELRGPAVADLEKAFAQNWAACGPPLPDDSELDRETLQPAGDVALRVIASVPNTAGLYRLDHLVTALARETLWLTDAYFVGTTPYIQALRAAAKDGVDVRLLVPGGSDTPLMPSISRAGYRPLLEAGVRVFEWNGSMLHAKTAVADGQWSRVGSTNLNIASWIGNWELDVAIEDFRVGEAMEDMYLEDLSHSTEIVLTARNRLRTSSTPEQPRRRRKGGRGSTGRVAAGAVTISNAVGAAITNHRLLGPAEAKIMVGAGLLLLGLSVVAVLWPFWITVPLAIIGLWAALALLIRAYKLHSGRGEFERPPAHEGLLPTPTRPRKSREAAP